MAGRGEDPAHQGLYRPLGRGRGHPRSLRRYARGLSARRHRSAFSGYFRGIPRHRQQDPAAAGGCLGPLAWLCSIQCRHHHSRTASQARPLHRPDAADLGRHPRRGHFSGLGQGHHDGAPRLHRPRGGHRRLGLSPATAKRARCVRCGRPLRRRGRGG